LDAVLNKRKEQGLATKKQQQVEAPQLELNVTIKDLLEAGAHFGHQTYRWNPKMKRFIFEERNGLHIIDLAKTMQLLRQSVEVVKDAVRQHKSILFVGTKKQAKVVVRELAEQCNEFYVTERWLGGLLTNPKVREMVKSLDRLEKRIAQGCDGLKKKEIALLCKEQERLETNLSGIRGMKRLPGLVVVVDPSREHIAVAEARKLGIPVMGLVDTNCDPDPIQYVIPCNDDALKSIKQVLMPIVQAVIDVKNEMRVPMMKGDEQQESEAELAIEAMAEKLEEVAE